MILGGLSKNNMNEQYKLTFFLNAFQRVIINQSPTPKELHTYEINCYISSPRLIEFTLMENCIKNELNKLNDKYLNSLSLFSNLNPTLENITRVLFNQLTNVLKSINCTLLKIAVSESPVRTFIITNQVL